MPSGYNTDRGRKEIFNTCFRALPLTVTIAMRSQCFSVMRISLVLKESLD